MRTPTLQHEFWPGPLRPTRPYHAIASTECIGMVRRPGGRKARCGQRTINGDFLCYACKDTGHYAERLRQARLHARQRGLEAYPVCQRCGYPLTQAQVEAGTTTHRWSRTDGCVLPAANEPLAQRRA